MNKIQGIHDSADYEALGTVIESVRKLTSAQLRTEDLEEWLDVAVLLSELRTIVGVKVRGSRGGGRMEVAADLRSGRTGPGYCRCSSIWLRTVAEYWRGGRTDDFGIAAYVLPESAPIRFSDNGPALPRRNVCFSRFKRAPPRPDWDCSSRGRSFGPSAASCTTRSVRENAASSSNFLRQRPWRPVLDEFIRILPIHDHSLFREAIARLLAGQPDFRIAGECSTVDDGIRVLASAPVDLVLLDINLGLQQGGAFPKLAREEGFTGKILVVTAGAKIEATRLLQLRLLADLLAGPPQAARSHSRGGRGNRQA